MYENGVVGGRFVCKWERNTQAGCLKEKKLKAKDFLKKESEHLVCGVKHKHRIL